MNITQEEHRALVDRLAELLAVTAYDPVSMVTIQDLAARMKVSREVAESELEKLREAGRLQRIEVRLASGRKGWAYVEAQAEG